MAATLSHCYSREMWACNESGGERAAIQTLRDVRCQPIAPVWTCGGFSTSFIGPSDVLLEAALPLRPRPVRLQVLAGPGVVAGNNNLGPWVSDTNGTLQLVFRSGETFFEVRPGVFRTINTFFYKDGTGQTGRASSINRKGQLSMDVTINGVPDLSANYILDLDSVGSGGGSGTSSFGSVQYIPGTSFQLNLNLQSGKSYRLQRTLSLSPTNWVTLTNFTSTGTNAQYLDSATSNPQGVYRVISP